MQVHSINAQLTTFKSHRSLGTARLSAAAPSNSSAKGRVRPRVCPICPAGGYPRLHRLNRRFARGRLVAGPILTLLFFASKKHVKDQWAEKLNHRVL